MIGDGPSQDRGAIPVALSPPRVRPPVLVPLPFRDFHLHWAFPRPYSSRYLRPSSCSSSFLTWMLRLYLESVYPKDDCTTALSLCWDRCISPADVPDSFSGSEVATADMVYNTQSRSDC